MRGRKVEMEIRNPVETATATGLTTQWTCLRRIQGVLRGLSANEQFAYQKRTLVATHRFTFDAVPGLPSIDKRYRFMNTSDGRQYVTVNADDVGGLGKQWSADLLEVT